METEMANIKPCCICGLYPTDINGVIRYTCGHAQKGEPEPPKTRPESFARDRRHNYRTAGMPPQTTDKHIDELK